VSPREVFSRLAKSAVHEGGEVVLELLAGVVVIPSDGRLIEGAVHPLDLAVGRRMIGLGQAMLETILPASPVEGIRGLRLTFPASEQRKTRVAGGD
jgi:hypothetical protein